jgi:hypothetical protein
MATDRKNTYVYIEKKGERVALYTFFFKDTIILCPCPYMVELVNITGHTYGHDVDTTEFFVSTDLR